MGLGQFSANADREMRRLEHHAFLNEELTQVDLETLTQEQAALLVPCLVASRYGLRLCGIRWCTVVYSGRLSTPDRLV